MRKVYTEKVLSDKHFAFLEKAMLASASGKDKFRAGLPKEIEVGHKTGMSYRTPEGVRMCDADVGVIYMPEGEKCYLAVLVKDSKESDAVNVKSWQTSPIRFTRIIRITQSRLLLPLNEPLSSKA